MNRSSAVLRGLLVFAVLWGLLLILASALLPVVTVLTGQDGPQPRQTLVEAHGAVAVVPALVGVAVTFFVAWLLGWGRGAVTSVSLAAARFVAVLVCVVAVVAVVTLHIVGVLVLPVAIALLTASLLGAVRFNS